MFCKKIVLRNLAKITRKHLCQSLFFRISFQSLFFLFFWPATLLKKRLWHRSFLWVLQSSKNTFSCRTPPVALSVRKTLSNIYDETFYGKEQWFHKIDRDSANYTVVWSISYNWLHEIPRNETHCCCYFILVILTELRFHFEW